MKQDKKVKTINVDADLHEEFKEYCYQNSLKINLFVERLISKSIRNLNESTKQRTE